MDHHGLLAGGAEDVGPAGVDKGEGKQITHPSARLQARCPRATSAPVGYLPGPCAFPVNLEAGTDADVAKGVA